VADGLAALMVKERVPSNRNWPGTPVATASPRSAIQVAVAVTST
jgi:hypothetical protein